MKIFISHSSKDKEVALCLKDFLERMNREEISVFCSSASGAIKIGDDFVKAIEKELDDSDQFIALVSDNYIRSPYCMIELGYAYAKLAHEESVIIKPLSLPGGEDLLDRTPLGHLQHYPLLDSKTYDLFIDELQDKGMDVSIGNITLRSFVLKATQACLNTMDIFDQADMIACCADPNNPNAIRCAKKEDSIVVNFNLFSNGKKKKPDFISAVYHFYNDLDLYGYYKADKNLRLHCVIENYTESIKQIQVEFQAENNRGIGLPIVFDMRAGDTVIDIPISSVSKYSKDLRRLSNICFVVLKDYFVENEGSFIIKDLQISAATD